MSQLDFLNSLGAEEAQAAFFRCCGATRWAQEMVAQRPFPNEEALFHTADIVWARMDEADYLEAFSHHPKIGSIENLRKKFGETARWSSAEQAGVQVASEAVLSTLASANQRYEERFGYIFIVCATGKTAAEMLALLQARLHNGPATELHIAAEEQRKITHIRLAKLLAEG